MNRINLKTLPTSDDDCGRMNGIRKIVKAVDEWKDVQGRRFSSMNDLLQSHYDRVYQSKIECLE